MLCFLLKHICSSGYNFNIPPCHPLHKKDITEAAIQNGTIMIPVYKIEYICQHHAFRKYNLILKLQVADFRFNKPTKYTAKNFGLLLGVCSLYYFKKLVYKLFAFSFSL